MKYKTKVTAIGAMVQELAEDGNLIILFNDDINVHFGDDLKEEVINNYLRTYGLSDLKDISVSHEVGVLNEDIFVGDKLTIGDKIFDVTSVGNIATKTLKDLGHCTLKFDGDIKSNLPGEIHVRGLVPEIKVGDIISFE